MELNEYHKPLNAVMTAAVAYRNPSCLPLRLHAGLDSALFS